MMSGHNAWIASEALSAASDQQASPTHPARTGPSWYSLAFLCSCSLGEIILPKKITHSCRCSENLYGFVVSRHGSRAWKV